MSNVTPAHKKANYNIYQIRGLIKERNQLKEENTRLKIQNDSLKIQLQDIKYLYKLPTKS